jgi:PKD repeat protein
VNCYLDVNGDGVAEQVINNCSNANFSWIYNDSKIYNATLIVFDKYGASSSKSLTIRACRVLYNGSKYVPKNSSVEVSSFIANQGDTLYIKAFVQSDTVINYIKVTNVVSTIDSAANSQTISRTIAIPEYREYRIIAGNTSTTSDKTYYIKATLNDVNCQ